MKLKSLLVILFAALLAVSCNNKKPGKDKAAPREEPKKATADGDAIINEIKTIYVCKKTGMAPAMYLVDAEEAGSLCPDGAKVLKWVERMIKEGWEREEILEVVRALKMDQPMMQKIGGQPACAQDGKIKAEYFIMSYCPFGVRYVTDVLMPMLADMGQSLDHMPYFIMNKDNTGKLVAMHGQKEVDENLRMICIREKWGLDKWLDYTKCFASEIYGNKAAPKPWSFCAEKAGIPTAELDACFKNDAAKLAETDLQMSRKYGAQGSPTAIYDCNNKIVGAIPYPQIKRSLCQLDKQGKISACKTAGG